MPGGEALTVGVTVTLYQGRGLHHGGRGLRLLGQAAADHVQPAFDPGPLLGIAPQKQPPSPQRRLDLQAADAPSASCAEADRDRLVCPAPPFWGVWSAGG